MPAPREERKNGCPSSLLLSHTLLKGRIKHFSELAATQSERSDSKRLRRGGVTELTGKEKATKGAGRLQSAGCLRKLGMTERRETNDYDSAMFRPGITERCLLIGEGGVYENRYTLLLNKN